MKPGRVCGQVKRKGPGAHTGAAYCTHTVNSNMRWQILAESFVKCFCTSDLDSGVRTSTRWRLHSHVCPLGWPPRIMLSCHPPPQILVSVRATRRRRLFRRGRLCHGRGRRGLTWTPRRSKAMRAYAVLTPIHRPLTAIKGSAWSSSSSEDVSAWRPWLVGRHMCHSSTDTRHTRISGDVPRIHNHNRARTDMVNRHKPLIAASRTRVPIARIVCLLSFIFIFIFSLLSRALPLLSRSMASPPQNSATVQWIQRTTPPVEQMIWTTHSQAWHIWNSALRCFHTSTMILRVGFIDVYTIVVPFKGFSRLPVERNRFMCSLWSHSILRFIHSWYSMVIPTRSSYQTLHPVLLPRIFRHAWSCSWAQFSACNARWWGEDAYFPSKFWYVSAQIRISSCTPSRITSNRTSTPTNARARHPSVLIAYLASWSSASGQ